MATAEPPQAPEVVCLSVEGVFRLERDIENGGLDQAAWNQGADVARAIGQAWRRIGAIENGEVLCMLADAVEAAERTDDAVKDFMRYRRAVGGPFYAIPEVMEEVGEALVEWAEENPGQFGRAKK